MGEYLYCVAVSVQEMVCVQVLEIKFSAINISVFEYIGIILILLIFVIDISISGRFVSRF